MSSPASLNFIESANNACIQGITFRTTLTLYDDADGTVVSDLTDLKGRVRIYDGSTQIWEGTTEDGSVVLGGLAGTFALTIPAEDTVDFTVGTYHIDIDIIDDALDPEEVDRIAHGDFEVVV